jgi:hypothetical protein
MVAAAALAAGAHLSACVMFFILCASTCAQEAPSDSEPCTARRGGHHILHFATLAAPERPKNKKALQEDSYRALRVSNFKIS